MFWIKPSHRIVTPKPSPARAPGTEPVTPSQSDPKTHIHEVPFVERRRNPDRRQQRQTRGPYEMRAGRDRRKQARGQPPSVDTEA